MPPALSGSCFANLFGSKTSLVLTAPGWSEGFTTDGKKYYKNRVAKTTTWDRPTAAADTPATQATSPANQAASPLGRF